MVTACPKTAGLLAALLAVATALLSCRQVLGIVDAETDPLYDAGNGLCATYCDTVASSCTGSNAVYTNRETCIGFCANLPSGQDGDEEGNSVQCRLTQAHNAAGTSEPELHCPWAGPAGGGTCGANCQSYCLVFEQICAEYYDQAYASQDECISQCSSTIPDLGTYDTTMSTGNSVQCRLWHLAAATVDPSHHCQHADGQSPCNP